MTIKIKLRILISPVLVMHGEVRSTLFLFGWEKKFMKLLINLKYSYFTKFDDHMMEYDEKLVSALETLH